MHHRRSRSRSPGEYNRHRRRSRSRSRERNRNETDESRGRSPQNGFSYRKDKKSSEEIQSERRRMERERICEMGVPEAWGLSPKARPMDDSDDDDKDLSAVNLKKTRTENHGKNESDDETDNDKIAKKHRKSSKKKKRKHKKKSKKRKKQESCSEDSEEESGENDDENEWLEKRKDEKTGDIVVGPLPVMSLQSATGDRMDFGGALLPGEGAAMANYVKAGKRIPRRGEIGLTSNEITSFEDEGYVMSGSRHRRMEAVRIRKENQIYSADEKRALAMFNYEERSKRETKILSDFRELVHTKINKQKSS